MGNKCLDCTALTLTIIGAINWGLIGFFRFDLVAFLFGDMSWLSRVCMHLLDYVDCIFTIYKRSDYGVCHSLAFLSVYN